MSILFIPNDPSAGAPDTRQQAARPDRPPSVARFRYQGGAAEAVYPLESVEFAFWQSREASLAVLEVWEHVAGPLKTWNGKVKEILFDCAGEVGTVGGYDRQVMRFGRSEVDGRTVFIGSSTDLVAHEIGHAVLDAMRPELWNATGTEHVAFHEAFGDCLSILVSLSDEPTRRAVLDLDSGMQGNNFVEALMEDLSSAIRKTAGPDHPASLPRHGRNDFVWCLPDGLPVIGRPGELTRDSHSFSQIFTGAFYDLIRLLFNASGDGSPSSLWNSASVAGRLLIESAKSALVEPRLFRSVGRAMVKADEALFGAVHRQAIATAFDRHGIQLGVSSMLMPMAALRGKVAAVQEARARATLSRPTMDHLRRRLDVPKGIRLRVEQARVFGEGASRVRHVRNVPLDDVDGRLRGVVAHSTEEVLIGTSGSAPALLGGLPDTEGADDDTRSLVRRLLDMDKIHMNKAHRRDSSRKHTHEVRSLRGERVLLRRRFLCGA